MVSIRYLLVVGEFSCRKRTPLPSVTFVSATPAGAGWGALRGARPQPPRRASGKRAAPARTRPRGLKAGPRPGAAEAGWRDSGPDPRAFPAPPGRPPSRPRPEVPGPG